jgi:hypothetical protein
MHSLPLPLQSGCRCRCNTPFEGVFAPSALGPHSLAGAEQVQRVQGLQISAPSHPESRFLDDVQILFRHHLLSLHAPFDWLKQARQRMRVPEFA